MHTHQFNKCSRTGEAFDGQTHFQQQFIHFRVFSQPNTNNNLYLFLIFSFLHCLLHKKENVMVMYNHPDQVNTAAEKPCWCRLSIKTAHKDVSVRENHCIVGPLMDKTWNETITGLILAGDRTREYWHQPTSPLLLPPDCQICPADTGRRDEHDGDWSSIIHTTSWVSAKILLLLL